MFSTSFISSSWEEEGTSIYEFSENEKKKKSGETELNEIVGLRSVKT